MITEAQIAIYKDCRDPDLFDRLASAEQRAIMTGNVWQRIESLIQDLTMINKGLASEDYVRMVNTRLQNECKDERTIALLRKLALSNA